MHNDRKEAEDASKIVLMGTVMHYYDKIKLPCKETFQLQQEIVKRYSKEKLE